jgi:hypothetical protein
MTRQTSLAALVFALLLGGCGGGGGTRVFREGQILTPEAGTYLYRGGRVSLTVALNAVTANTAVEIRNPPSTPVPFDEAVLSDTVYEFTPVTFNSAATVAIGYDPADIPSGYSEANLRVVRLSSGEWVAQSATADATNDRLTFSASTLGTYAIRINGFVAN